MGEWQELAERAAQLDGPDKELDADFAKLLGHEIRWEQTRYTMQSFPVIRWREPHPYAGMTEPCPEFTASADAMIRLICQTLPWSWRVGNLPSGKAFAQLGTHQAEHIAAAPSLALLVAYALAQAGKEAP